MGVEVSFVTVTLNSERTLEGCLKSIFNLKTKRSFEVLVVDGGSTDRTVEIAKRYKTRVFIDKKRTRGACRNTGVRNARGEMIAFVDSDCMPEENWLDLIVKHLDDKTAGVGGKSIPDTPTQVGPIIRDGQVENIPTNNSVYWRHVIEEVGYFDEKMEAEDMDLNWRIIDRSYHLAYAPEAVVTHLERPNMHRFIRIYGIGAAQLAKKPYARPWVKRNFRLAPIALIGFPALLFYYLMKGEPRVGVRKFFIAYGMVKGRFSSE